MACINVCEVMHTYGCAGSAHVLTCVGLCACMGGLVHIGMYVSLCICIHIYVCLGRSHIHVGVGCVQEAREYMFTCMWCVHTHGLCICVFVHMCIGIHVGKQT